MEAAAQFPRACCSPAQSATSRLWIRSSREQEQSGAPFIWLHICTLRVLIIDFSVIFIFKWQLSSGLTFTLVQEDDYTASEMLKNNFKGEKSLLQYAQCFTEVTVRGQQRKVPATPPAITIPARVPSASTLQGLVRIFAFDTQLVSFIDRCWTTQKLKWKPWEIGITSLGVTKEEGGEANCTICKCILQSM